MVFAFALLVTSAAHAQQFRAYVGTYTGSGSISKGIYSTVFDSASGKLAEPMLAAETVSPSFLAIHPNGRTLFAVNEVHEGGGKGNATISAFQIASDGALTFLNHQPSLGGAPCHCNVDATGKFLLVANYMGGNVVVLPINADGSLDEVCCNVSHTGSSVDKSRQEMPHAHSINLSADNKFAYAADLGIDQIRIYRFDAATGQLSPANPDSVSVKPGGGPRHFALHPSGKYAYTNNELTCVATAFRRDPQTGRLDVMQDISTLPEGVNVRRSTAECLVHPSGRFLYVSNRGHESIAGFSIDEDTGQLTSIEVTQTGGKEPRNFVIDPTGRWLIAENQNSDTVIVFSLDLQTGRLKQTDSRIQVGRPVCIRMVTIP